MSVNSVHVRIVGLESESIVRLRTYLQDFDYPMAAAKGMSALAVVHLILCAGKKHELNSDQLLRSKQQQRIACSFFRFRFGRQHRQERSEIIYTSTLPECVKIKQYLLCWSQY